MRLKLKYLQPKPNFAFVFIFLGCTLYSVHVKGDGGVGTFDVGGGGPAFIFGSNLPIFWLHAY